MDFKVVIWIGVISSCVSCIVSNESVLRPQCKPSVSKMNLMVPGERAEATGYKVLHDFNFPDVTYPTTALESCQPFYFNSNSLDAIVGPFSSDVQLNYKSLLSPNENKIKDVVAQKSIVDDKIQYQTSLSNIYSNDYDSNKNEPNNDDALKVVRKLFESYIAKNHIDSELKEILSVLFSDNIKESKSSERNNINPRTEAEPLLDEIIGNNFTLNQSSGEKITEPIEQLIDKLSEPNIMSSVMEELKEFVDKINDKNLITNLSLERNTTVTVDYAPNLLIDSAQRDYIITEHPSINKTNNSNVITDIELQLELTKEDVEFILLNNTNHDVSYSNRNNDYKGTETESVNKFDELVLIPEFTVLSEVNLDSKKFSNYSVSNENLNKTQLENDTFNSISQSIEEIVDEPIKSDNVSVVDSTDDTAFNIPKEPVVFDVVYRDAYNLEKPVLDIVPSSIPVRLKINIEIVKHDSNEIDDFYKINNMNNYEQFAPRIYENNMNVVNISNSIENAEEDLVPEEQITVLDEINESDFINALSILLLDSLNNNPLEIIPPDYVTSENVSCNLFMENPVQPANNLLMNELNFANNIHNIDTQPIPTPEISLLRDNSDKEQTEIESNIVKYNTSPLIEMLKSFITSELSVDSKTDFLKIDNLKPNYNENETFNQDISPEKKNMNVNKDFISLNKACNFENFKEIDNVENTSPNTTWPLVDVFQLKICPKEVDPGNK